MITDRRFGTRWDEVSRNFCREGSEKSFCKERSKKLLYNMIVIRRDLSFHYYYFIISCVWWTQFFQDTKQFKIHVFFLLSIKGLINDLEAKIRIEKLGAQENGFIIIIIVHSVLWLDSMIWRIWKFYQTSRIHEFDK